MLITMVGAADNNSGNYDRKNSLTFAVPNMTNPNPKSLPLIAALTPTSADFAATIAACAQMISEPGNLESIVEHLKGIELHMFGPAIDEHINAAAKLITEMLLLSFGDHANHWFPKYQTLFLDVLSTIASETDYINETDANTFESLTFTWGDSDTASIIVDGSTFEITAEPATPVWYTIRQDGQIASAGWYKGRDVVRWIAHHTNGAAWERSVSGETA